MFFFACSQISMEALVKSCNSCWFLSVTPGPCARFSEITKQQYLWEGFQLFCIFVAWKLQCYHVVLVGYGRVCTKFSEATNQQYLWNGSSDFVDFLQVVICILLDIPGCAGIGRHRLLANQIVRCFKLKKLKKNMRYQVDSLLPLKLEELLCYYGL